MTKKKSNKPPLKQVSIELLKSSLEYRDGQLFWTETTPSRNRVEGKRAGCLLKTGYRIVKVGNTSVMEHRLIWALHHGAWPREYIDHIDRNRANNRIENLRECSHRENMSNMGIRVDRAATSRYKGVSFHRRSRKWNARIDYKGYGINLGLYRTEENAARAYNQAAEDLHGEFAVLNVLNVLPVKGKK